MKSFSEMTDEEMEDVIHTMLKHIENSGVAMAEITAKSFAKMGAISGTNVGMENMTRRQELDWFAGQFISIVEAKAWWAMNSFLNYGEHFLRRDSSES